MLGSIFNDLNSCFLLELCLSPDITSFDSSPDQTRTSTALFLEWDTPTTSLRAECQDIVVSTPPLIYVMEGLQSGNTFEQVIIIKKLCNVVIIK